MRSIILVLSLILISLSAAAQTQSNFEQNRKTINEFFDKYENLEDVTHIEIGSAMTKILASNLFMEGDDSSAKLLRSIKSIDILAETSEGKSHIRGEMFSLPDQCKGYELITSINESGELSNFYFAQHEDSNLCEFLMLVRQYDTRVVLYITGEFSVNDITALSTLSDGIGK